MALTTEQQAQIELQIAMDTARHNTQKIADDARHANQMEIEAKRAKLEAVRLAKEILLENARSLPVDSRGVSADDVTSFAASLVGYVNN